MGKRSRAGSSHSRNGADQGARGSNNSGWLDFGETPMGVGNSRLAFRCRVRDGCCYGYTEGSYLIFKVFKPEDMWSQVDSVGPADVRMQQRVRALAEEFNDECRPTKYGESCDIICRDAALGAFEDDHTLRDQYGRHFRVDEGTSFLLEREIRGSFEKFSSNSGWLSGEDDILEAFSHWSWCRSDEEELVCDLQGYRGDGSLPHLGNDYYYLLTDPAICSSDRLYGESDLGQQVRCVALWRRLRPHTVPLTRARAGLCPDMADGSPVPTARLQFLMRVSGWQGINAFFANHTCNEWCEQLDIEYERPQYVSNGLSMSKSTSYYSLTY
jgi:hypothetical protein